MGIYETDESIKDRLKAACAAEGLVAVDKRYLADLEMIVRRWLDGDVTFEDTREIIKRINDVWDSDE